MWTTRVFVLLVATPLVMVAAQAPPPPPPMPSAAGLNSATAAVSGAVVDATTGAPIAGAIVEVSIDGRPVRTDASRARASDDRGRVVFDGLPPGDIAVRASAIGYLSSGFAAEGWSRVDRFPVRSGEWISDIRIPLNRPGVIAGTVSDERGGLVVGVIVGVVERIRVAGADRFMSGRAAVTDDRGQYRIIDLTPGDYLVQVPGSEATTLVNSIQTPWPGQPPTPPPDVDGVRRTYPTSLHPGVRIASLAQVVSLRAGETREAIDVALAPSPATHVSCSIEGPPEWITGLAVRLLPEAGTGVAAEALDTRTDDAGRFALDRVPEGAYTMVVGRRWSELTRGLRFGEPSLRSPDVGSMAQDLESGPPGLHLQVRTMSGLHALVASPS